MSLQETKSNEIVEVVWQYKWMWHIGLYRFVFNVVSCKRVCVAPFAGNELGDFRMRQSGRNCTRKNPPSYPGEATRRGEMSFEDTFSRSRPKDRIDARLVLARMRYVKLSQCFRRIEVRPSTIPLLTGAENGRLAKQTHSSC